MPTAMFSSFQLLRPLSQLVNTSRLSEDREVLRELQPERELVTSADTANPFAQERNFFGCFPY